MTLARYTITCRQADATGVFFAKWSDKAHELAWKFAENPDNLTVEVVGPQGTRTIYYRQDRSGQVVSS